MHGHYVLEQLTAAVMAAEDWAPSYNNTPKQHAALIKTTAKLQREVLMYLKQLSDDAAQFVDWYAYSRAVIEQQHAIKGSSIQAYDINVVVNKDAVNAQDQEFIKIVFDTVASATLAGMESMDVVTGKAMAVGLTTSSSIIQNLTTNQLAALVGMRQDPKTGLFKPNKNINPATGKAYSIDETTRTRIANSIKKSIDMGENHTAALHRLTNVIADTARADMIAHTETVRAFALGRHQYAIDSGATGKYNVDSGAKDDCKTNSGQGVIPLLELFFTGQLHEPFHPFCICQTVYDYD